VDDFYAARSGSIPPLPWSNFAPPFSHHAPFPGSIHPDFQGDALNAFFVNNLNPERFPKTQLWIHGHVHTPFDYLVPAGDHEMRVVCNPLGYPMTRVRRRVGVKVAEIGVQTLFP
jgi:hypothetical protein